MSNENFILTGDDIDINTEIYINAFPLFGKNIIIQTTNKYIIENITYLKNYPICHLQEIYSNLYSNTIDVNHLDIIKNIKINKFKNKWKNLCEDILKAYLIRFILTNKYIPIFPTQNLEVNVNYLVLD